MRSRTRMLFSLDFLVFTVIFVLTLTLLLVNYVAYLSRGRKYTSLYAVGALLLGGFVIGVFLSPYMPGLAEQYGTSEILSRWGFTFGWAFMLTLAGGCAAIYERSSESRISVTINVVATLMLGFALVAGLLFSGQSLPPFPTSIVNLGLAAVFTSILKLVFEKRKEKKKEMKRERKSFRERLADLIKG